MTKEDKAEVLAELDGKFEKYPYFYVLDSAGMTVDKVNAFRRTCFGKGLEYKVFKNSLIKKALSKREGDFTAFNDQVLKGFSGIVFSEHSGSEPAKMLKKFYEKGNEQPVFKGASIDSSFYIGPNQIEALTKVKSKADLLAELIGLLQSPAQNLVRALQSPPQKLVSALQGGNNKLTGILKALEEKQSA